MNKSVLPQTTNSQHKKQEELSSNSYKKERNEIKNATNCMSSKPNDLDDSNNESSDQYKIEKYSNNYEEPPSYNDVVAE